MRRSERRPEGYGGARQGRKRQCASAQPRPLSCPPEIHSLSDVLYPSPALKALCQYPIPQHAMDSCLGIPGPKNATKHIDQLLPRVLPAAAAVVVGVRVSAGGIGQWGAEPYPLVRLIPCQVIDEARIVPVPAQRWSIPHGPVLRPAPPFGG